jgi:hypothetical protein
MEGQKSCRQATAKGKVVITGHWHRRPMGASRGRSAVKEKKKKKSCESDESAVGSETTRQQLQ